MVNPLASCFEWFLEIYAFLYTTPVGAFLNLVILLLTISSIIRWFS